MAHIARRMPCAVMALGVISILLPQFLFPENPLWASLLPVFFLLLAGSVFSLSVAVWKFALAALLVWVSFLFWQNKIENDPVKLFAANREQVGIIAIVRAEDSSLFGNNKLLPNPKRVQCRLLRGAYSPLEKMHSIDGKILLRLPYDFSGELSYGDILLVEGILERPSEPLFEKAFNYRSYLERRAVHYILQANKVEKSHRERSCTSFLLDLRKNFAEKILLQLPEKNRAFIAALLFGCAQNVAKETKSDLIRTGTIHILTVSGLHIGFFVAFIALLCIFLPFQMRMFCIPFLAFFYAWMTGLNMPALRAVLMLSSYCFARGLLLNSSAKNALFFAFVLLMNLYPMQFIDAGMHFSFITTFALLLAGENIALWGKIFQEKYAFIPHKTLSRKEGFSRKLQYILLRIFAGCCAAWGASFVLTLFYQGIATPFSVMVNFLFVPLVWLSFPVFFLGAFLALFLPLSGELTAYILQVLTDLLIHISSFAAGKSDIVLPRPSLYTAAAFLLVFFLLLWEKKHVKLILSSFLILLCFILFFAGNLFPEKPEILVINGFGKERGCILISIPEYKYAFFMDAGNYEMVMNGASYFRSRGHNKINTLVSSSVKGNDVGALKYIFNTLHVERLVMPESSPFARKAAELRKKALLENTLNRTLKNQNDPFCKFVLENDEIKEIRIVCFLYAFSLVFHPEKLLIYRNNSGEKMKKELIKEIALLRTSKEKIYSCKLY